MEPDPRSGEPVSEGGRGERFFDQLFERSPVAMQIFSPDGTLLRTNEAFRRFLALPGLDTGVGRFNILTDPFSMKAGSPERFRRALAGETVEHRDQSLELNELVKQKDPSRSWVYFDSAFFPVYRDSGAVEAVVLMLWDTSDRKRAELAQSEFISVLSHELRTPLTSIRGSLCLLAAGIPETLSPVAASMVDIAMRNSERLLVLINDLLDIQQITSGRLEMRLRGVHLEPLVLQSLEENMGLASDLGVAFSLVRTDAEVRAMADPVRFLQLMANLLSNAAKFSPPQGIVEVSLAHENGHARLSVRDHGPGIPEDFRSRVFSSFAQADTSSTRARGGTGLGLSITKVLVEHMGGRIDFETEAGLGTAFHVFLPALG
jgi:signal transduction histidine kinase